MVGTGAESARDEAKLGADPGGPPGHATTGEAPSGQAFVIGSEVSCSDGACGKLTRVVVDPVARKLTHLVVTPTGEVGRLVDVGLATPAEGGIRLACTTEQFDHLEFAEEEQFIAGASGGWDYGEESLLQWPYYGLGQPGPSYPYPGYLPGDGTGPYAITYDRVPIGEVEVRRGDHVHATDGRVGRVEGLVVDASDHGVTHFLLEEGHLWGKKEIAIPIGAVSEVGDGVRLRLSKDEVRDLPAVELDRAS